MQQEIRETIEDDEAYWPTDEWKNSMTTCIRCRQQILRAVTNAVSTRISTGKQARKVVRVGRICPSCLLVIGAGGRVE